MNGPTELDQLLESWMSDTLTLEQLEALARYMENLDAEPDDAERIRAGIHTALGLMRLKEGDIVVPSTPASPRYTHKTLQIFLGPGQNGYGHNE